MTPKTVKLKFLQRFTKIRNINAPQGVSLVRFSRNLQSLNPVSGALTVKIWMDLLTKLRGFCFPQIFSVPYRRNYALDPKSFLGGRTCSMSSIYHRTKLVGWGWNFTRRRDSQKRSFLFVRWFLSYGAPERTWKKLFINYLFEQITLCSNK